MLARALVVLAAITAGLGALAGSPGAPVATAATCASHPDQRSAQQAKDTRDADGDGLYCETLPCPCAAGNPSGPVSPPPGRAASCVRSSGIVDIGFSRTAYPHIRRHAADAIAAGWPRTLVVNRPGAEQRRGRALRGEATSSGSDRDEYPPAVGRGRGTGLRRGSSPVGWEADVRLVPSSENRSHGSRLGIKLRRFCNGTRFRYVFY